MLKLDIFAKSVLCTVGLMLAPVVQGRGEPDGAGVKGLEKFPLIFYAVHDNEKAFEDVRQWGGTHVHSYGMGKSIEADREFFDRAARHDLKVMANLDGASRVPAEGGLEAMRAYVAHFKEHPAFSLWYLYDEPAGRVEPAVMEPFYQMLKAETPERLVANAHEWTEGWNRFSKVQDVLMNDTYPVTGAPFPEAKLGVQTKFTKSALRSRNIVFPVIQIMSWEAFAKPGETEKRGYPIAELRYPNLTELRYMSFSSIALGAKGLGFFSYGRSMATNPQWAGQILPPLLQEIAQFAEAIGYPQVEQIALGELEENLIAGLWSNAGAQWLLVANASGEPLGISSTLHPQLKSGRLVPWGTTRAAEATLENGILSVEAEPWEVLIWQVD